MGLYKRGDIYWYRDTFNNQKYRDSTQTKSRRDAENWVQSLWERRGRGETPAARRLGYEQMRDAMIADYRLNGHRSLDILLQVRLKHLDPYFGGKRAADITIDEIRDYKAGRKAEGSSNASVNRELAALRRMFTLAQEAHHAIVIPHFEMLSEKEAIRQVELSRGDFLAIQRELPQRLRDPVEFLYRTGVRKMAMVTLEWRSISNDRIIIRIEHSKNKEPVSIPLVGELGEIIERARERQRVDCPLVFHDGGQSLGKFNKAWNRACIKAGFHRLDQHGRVRSAFVIHDLCKAAITNLVAVLKDHKKVSERTGRKTNSTIDRYNIVTHTEADSLAVDAYIEKQSTRPSVTVLRTQNAQPNGDTTVPGLCPDQTQTDRLNGKRANSQN